MTSKTIAKPCAQSTLTVAAPVPTAAPFDLIQEFKNERERNGLDQAALAAKVGCTVSDIRKIERGVGNVAVLFRAMAIMHFDLTGIAPGTLMCSRLRRTRERRKTWSVERFADKCNLPAKRIADLEQGVGRVEDFLTVLKTLAPNYNRRGGAGGKGGDKDSRCITDDLADATKSCFGEGRVDFDPCANFLSPVKPERGCYWELGQDGLAASWEGRFVFVNPPFSNLAVWTNYGLAQWNAGKIEILALLIPTRTDTSFFVEALNRGAAVFFFGERLKFIKPDGTVEASKITTMLVVFGSNQQQRAAFGALQKGVWVELAKGLSNEESNREQNERAPSCTERQEKNFQTSCPDSQPPAHVKDEGTKIPAERVPADIQELEAYYRDPHGLRKRAEFYARRCQTDADDLLSDAIERALRYPRWGGGVRERMDGILSSSSSTINRARARAKLRGVELVSTADGHILDKAFPITPDVDEDRERERKRQASADALARLCRGDPVMSSLVDGIGAGLRGKRLQSAMGVSELELATVRRRLKRKAFACLRGDHNDRHH